MPTLKLSLFALLLSACEGPTLWVAEREELDAGSDERDAGARDARVVDAQRDAKLNAIIVCKDNRDCPDFLPRCHSSGNVCVECQYDRDCQSNRCNDEWWTWTCRPEDDRPRP